MAGGIIDFFRRLRRMINGELVQTISEVSKEQSVVSNSMMQAISLWSAMFEGDPDYLDDDTSTLSLPSIIASEVARAVTLEMKVTVTGSEMGVFLDEELEPVRKHIITNVEYAAATGGIVFKPYVYDDGITVEIIHADAFYPISFDNAGKITAAFFLYRKWEGKKIYTRVERHELDGTTYTVTNKAYVSTIEEALGRECLLSEVTEWEDIEPEVTMENVDNMLFSYFKMPMANTVESKSPMGVSVYAKAVGLIRDAEEQYQRLLWEYEGGELAIDASEDAFRFFNGQPLLPEGKERLYRTNTLDPSDSNSSNLFKEWAPNLRDSNYISGLQKILRQVEDACSLYRGSLSDPESDPRTATEIKTTRQRFYSLVSQTQEALESALDDLVKAMKSIAILYELAPDGEYETSYLWDDSIVMDSETERQKDLNDVREGLMTKYEYRMKWYGEDEETAKQKIEEIKQQNSQGLSEEMIMGFMNEPTEGEGSQNSTPPAEEPEE